MLPLPALRRTAKPANLTAMMFTLAALTTWVILTLTGCGGENNKVRALKTTASVIAQGYNKLAEKTAALNTQANSFCTAPKQAEFAQTRAAWEASMDAWMQIQPIGFGPVRSLDMVYKIQFWPDPRDMVGQQIQKQIDTAEDDAAVMKSRLDKASVAVHGLPAVEALLYPDGDDALQLFDKPQRCQVLLAVTANLADSTTQLAQAWTASDNSYARQLQNFGGEQDEFATADAALSAVVGSILQSLDFISGSKLGWPLGVRADNVPQPFRVESRRSRRSLANIHANLAGIETLFTAGSDYGIEDYLRSLDGGAHLADQFIFELRKGQQQTLSLEALFPALQANNNLQGYQELLNTIQRLTELLDSKIAAELGISTGLNFNDGD